MLIQNVWLCSVGQVVGNLLYISLWIESNKSIVSLQYLSAYKVHTLLVEDNKIVFIW